MTSLDQEYSEVYVNRRILKCLNDGEEDEVMCSASVTYEHPMGHSIALEEAVIEAIKLGNYKMTDYLLWRPRVNVRYVDHEGRRFIHHAAECGDISILELILRTGTPVMAQDVRGWHPLHYAAMRGHFSVLDLLARHSSVNKPRTQKPDGFSALHLAVRGGHAEAVRVLLQRGAYVEALSCSGRTPLHLAVELGYIDVCELLLTAGAPPSFPDMHGISPAHLAAQHERMQELEELHVYGAEFNMGDSRGRTPLHYAMLYEKWSAAEWLVKQPFVDVNRVCHQGVSVLHLAVQGGCDPALLSLLLHAGANVNVRTEDNGDTPLMLACSNSSRLTHLKSLLEAGASVNVPDKSMTTPLHRALIMQHPERLDVLQTLVQAGAALNREDQHGASPLAKTVFQTVIDRSDGSFEDLKLLVRSGAMLGVPPPVLRLNLPVAVAGARRPTNSPVAFLAWRRFWHAVVFLVRCGWDVANDKSLQRVLRAELNGDERREQVLQWIDSCISNPRSLQHNCRSAVRRHLSTLTEGQIIDLIFQLPLPQRLLNYILFEPEISTFWNVDILADNS